MTHIGLIIGASGQDSSYLAELLLEKGYIVYGMVRRNSIDKYPNIEHIRDKINVIYGDITDYASVSSTFNTIFTQEGKDFDSLFVFALAAQSHVKVSFDIPIYTSMVDAIGTLNVLECIRHSPFKNKIRIYQASTSELYGDVLETPQTETTPFNPQSPYAIAKLYAYWMIKNYRQSYGLFACNGILFNHTSIRRGENFVCRKIAMATARICEDKQDCLYLGNLSAKRDLGHAKDYVDGMLKILLHDKPDDFVLSMNETYSVREIVEMCFKVLHKNVIWEGKGLEEVGKVDDRVVVRVDPKFFRPSEVNLLLGDSTKARTILSWSPTYSTQEILQEMVLYEVDQCLSGK